MAGGLLSLRGLRDTRATVGETECLAGQGDALTDKRCKPSQRPRLCPECRPSEPGCLYCLAILVPHRLRGTDFGHSQQCTPRPLRPAASRSSVPALQS